MRQEELIKSTTTRAVLRYSIIASGWVFLGIYLAAEYQEFGTHIFTHITSNESPHQALFHRAMLLAPVISTFVGYVMKKRDTAEENTRKSEDRYRGLLELAQEGIWTIDKDNITTFVNSSMASMLGYSIDEMMGRDLFSFMDERGVETCKRNIERRKQGIKEQHDFEFIHKDGSRVFTAMETAPILDERGNYAGAIAGVIDITERNRVEEAIRKAEGELRSIYNAISGHLTVISPDYRILSYNETVEKQFGGDIKGRRCYEAYQARDKVCPDCAVKETLDTKKPAYTFQPATSVSKPVDIYTYPIFDDNGEVAAVVEHGLEVTERVELEEKLNRQRVLLNTVFETIPDIVYMKDKEGKYLLVNQAYEKCFGIGRDEVLGKTMEDILPRESAENFLESDRLVFGGEVYRGEQRLVINGKDLVFDTIKMPLRDDDGNIYGLVGVSHDITDRKRSEESRILLLKAVESLTVGVTISDADGKIIYTNPAEAAMHGYDVMELQGKDVNSLAPPELRKRLQLKDRGSSFSRESLNMRKDGSVFPVYLTSVGVEGEDGKPFTIITVSEDITERKRTEDALNEGKQFLSDILDSIQDGICIISKDFTIMMVNRTTEEWYADKMPFDGKKCHEVFRESPVVCEHCPAIKVFETGESVSEIVPFHRPDGTLGSGELHAFPFLNLETGEVMGCIEYFRDITERKQAEEEIKEINARLKTLVDSIPGMVFFKDAEGRHLVVNRACVEMIGLKEEEIIGKTADEILPPKVAAHCNESDAEVIRAGETVRVEEDTGEKVLETVKAPLFDESGNYTGMVGLGFDVTQRRRAADALKESEERYRGLFDSARDAIFIAEIESGTIVNANRQAERLLGLPASEIIGMHQSELHPEEERESYGTAFKKAVMQGRAVSPNPGGDIYVVNKNGEKIPVEISANVIELEGKRLLQGIFRDITERRAAERAAREGKQYLENVLNSIQDGICIVARDFSIVLANPTIEKWYAHRAPVVGRKCYEVFKGRAEVCDPCPCVEARDKGESCFDVVNYHGPEGRGGTLELYGFPLSDPSTGEVTGMVQYYRDITDRVALQAEAFRAAQLASVGELAAGVAHEINNPINGIINYAQLLTNRLPKGSEENSLSRRIIKEGDRISGIVSALLTFTREDDLVEEPVDLEDLVLESLSLTIAQLVKDGIDVRITITEDMPKVNMKRQHLEQVFLNLINNARHALNAKYPEAHPEKVLEVTGESMAAEDIPHVRISFTDRGTGIAPDIIERVTEPFFTTKQKGSGTGLGLSISSSIIKNKGGTLSIESVEGEYTKVTIELPVGEAK
jgi:PAS domain S-box-containing protein